MLLEALRIKINQPISKDRIQDYPFESQERSPIHHGVPTVLPRCPHIASGVDFLKLFAILLWISFDSSLQTVHFCVLVIFVSLFRVKADKNDGGLDVKAIMDTWTLQMGYPLVTLERIDRTRVTAYQEHYLSNPAEGVSEKYGDQG